MFMDNLKETLNEDFNTSVTENGAVGYRTSGKKLLDLNFSVTSMRNMSKADIIDKFEKAYYENPKLAVKWLFFARDVREGLGERRLFRVCIKDMVDGNEELVRTLIPLVPEYGRWDDLWCLLDTELKGDVIALIRETLMDDLTNYAINSPISLLAKWLPSINTSSQETKRYAHIIKNGLYLTEKAYRQTLSKLRKYLDVTEVKMSSNDWSSINYSAVPSRANLIYNNAFLRNDEERRREYLAALLKGETKINAGVLYPHDIVHKCAGSYDESLEELWKALPDYVNGAGNTICVADGSRSMTSSVGHTKVTALEVANALAIYFSERCSGEFKDKYITFSENPQLVDLSNATSLKDKIRVARRYNEVANTNIEAVFDLILQTATNGNMSQEDLPQNILILSDMEFDDCVGVDSGERDWWGRPIMIAPTDNLFKTFADRYAEHGYKLPRLVFWNICSRTETIPVRENDLGVALVSGFSPMIAKMVLSNKTDPFECLLEQLNSDRYSAVEESIKDIL